VLAVGVLLQGVFQRHDGRLVAADLVIEDAEGMYALCFYYLSPAPSRDQTMTGQAIMAINEFISRYPNSDQIENFRKINRIQKRCIWPIQFTTGRRNKRKWRKQ